jgi:hypothetical protein
MAQQMGEQGRKLVNEQFDFGKYIGDLEEMFARVRGKKSPAFAAA